MALGMLVSAPCLLPGQWVAFNDHGSATNTHPRTTRYHMFSLEDGSSGPLRDIVTGAALPVHLTLERSGFMAADAVGVNPAEGTPLARTFEGFVDFTSTNENLGTRFSGTVTFTLSGLTPGQAYRIQGGTVRGGEALTNRWTLMELLGAEAFEHRHSAGILTSNQVAAILANQAAANFGANHTPDTGDMMDWIVLDAGQDGEVRLVFRAYTGTVPGGSSSGATGYVPTALKVREETEQDAITLVDAPLPVNVIEGQPAAFSVLALGDPLSYQWFRDGLPIDGATQRVHRIAATVAADDGAFFSVQVSNHTGVVTAGPALLSVVRPPFPVVAYDHVWRYNRSAIDPGPTWQDPGYDDAAWPSGPGPLGYPASDPLPVPIATTFASNNEFPYFFRSSFLFEEEPNEFLLTLTHLIDDGAVFYLNGQEVLRFNMPPPPQPIQLATPASSPVADAVLISADVPSSALVKGTNVVAVQVQQLNTSSSDLVMGLELWAQLAPPSPLSILEQPQDLVLEEGQEGSLTVLVAGYGARFQWVKDGAALPGARERTLRFAPVNAADSGEYFVVVSNALSFLVSDTARLTVTSDTNSPTLVDADGSVSPDATRILVSFSERVDPLTATLAPSYQLESTMGDMPAVLGVEMAGDSAVLLRTEPRQTGHNHLLTVQGVTDLAFSRNPIAPASRIAVRMWITLLPFGSHWHVYDPIPDVDPPLAGQEWIEPGYPLDSWGYGPGGFVYDLAGTAWPVPARSFLAGGPISSYFRSAFDFEASPFGAEVRVRHVVDAGAAFYLNGAEVFRHNLPEGELSQDTRASQEFPVVTLQGSPRSGDVPLLGGMNVFAAELHASTPEDFDRFFDAELQAYVMSQASGPIVILSHPASLTVSEGAMASFHVESVGAAGLQWLRDGQPIAGAHQATYVLPQAPLNLNGAQFSVLLTNQTHMLLSEPATLQVVAENPPLLTIERDNGLVLLSWTEPGLLLEETDALAGSNTVWTSLPLAVPPHPVNATNAARFYRLRD